MIAFGVAAILATGAVIAAKMMSPDLSPKPIAYVVAWVLVFAMCLIGLQLGQFFAEMIV